LASCDSMIRLKSAWGGAMAEESLFENLADQAAPERPRGKPRLQEPRRDAVALRVVDLEELVAADDPVRDVWAYVERLDLRVFDGRRGGAAAGVACFGRGESLNEGLAKARGLGEVLAREGTAVPGAEDRGRGAARERAAAERVARIAAAQQRYEELQAERRRR